MKEKYYKDINILNARLGTDPSYLWRSVCGVLPLVKAGMRWRIGNGRKVRIWGDNWLPTTQSTFQVQSPVKVLNQDATIRELINHDGKSWDEELIFQVLNEEEARTVCSLPLSKLGSEDKLIWGMSSNGLFSVKSAYYLAVQRKKQMGVEQSNISRDFLRSQCIWKMRVPQSVKIFIWKAINEALPTKRNLFHRRITEIALCPICEQSKETSHALWSCGVASDVWAEQCVPQKWSSAKDEFSNVWERLVSGLNMQKLGEVACVLQKI